MTMFSEAELAYLQGDAGLGRIATVGRDGMPHVTPVGWKVDAEAGVIEISGSNFAATKKFRDVERTGRAAIVIDDVRPPWRPRGVEIRGRAEAVREPDARIRIHPERIVAWGLDA
jgi:pyridoxamine 5'-phosphate oxidase family protein